MKKGFKLLSLLLCMSLFMTGCGPLEAILDSVRTEISDDRESEETSEETETEETEAEETETEESVSEESTSEESTSEESKTEESKSEEPKTEETEILFSVGEVKGQTYTNEYLGIQCVLDSTWTYFGETELIEVHNGAVESSPFNYDTLEEFNEENVKAIVDGGVDVTIMAAGGYKGTISIGITGNVSKSDMPGGKKYEEFITGYVEGMEYGLLLAGNSDVTGELETATFMGKETDCVSYEYINTGLYCYQKTVFLYKDSYRVSVNAISFVDEESAVQLLDNVTSCEGADFVVADAMDIVITDDTDNTVGETNEKAAVLGYVEDYVYINEELGLQCELDSSWDFASIEELEEKSNLDYEEESLKDSLDSGMSINVLEAESLGGTISIMIADTDALWGGLPLDTMQEFIAEMYQSTLTEGLSSQYDKFEMVRTEEDFMGEEAYLSFDIDITHQGIAVHQKHVYQPMGEYYVTIVATGMSDETAQEMMDCFSKYEP